MTDIFEQLASGGAKSSRQGGELKLGISTLPPLSKDTTDRNRTSPFAFTGNKFEFRMVGSSQSTAGPTFVLNTIVAEIMSEIADELEKAKDVKAAVQKILQKIAKEHRRVIYNGDNYTAQWQQEAKKRGLGNMPSAVDALNTIMDKQNVEIFEKHRVLSEAELHARAEILLENYIKTLNIEALTMLNIARRQIIPAVMTYSGRLADVVKSLDSVKVKADAQRDVLGRVSKLVNSLQDKVEALQAAVGKAAKIENGAKRRKATAIMLFP